MKIIIYKTYTPSSFHIHAGIESTIIHIVDLNVYLYKERQGSFGSNDYGIVTNQTYIDILSGISINYEGIRFEKVKEYNVDIEDDDIIRGLVSKAKLYDILKVDVKNGIDDIID